MPRNLTVKSTQPRPRLLEQLRQAIRTKQYSYNTEQAYCYWVRFFVHYHELTHPRELNEVHIANFLTYIAVERKVAASTQNQCLNALVFLYKYVLGRPLGDLPQVQRAKRPKNLPVVFTHEEVVRIFSEMDGLTKLVANIFYGSGLRLMECLRLRIKDIEIPKQQLTVRRGKGGKDQVTVLPHCLCKPVEQAIDAPDITMSLISQTV